MVVIVALHYLDLCHGLHFLHKLILLGLIFDFQLAEELVYSKLVRVRLFLILGPDQLVMVIINILAIGCHPETGLSSTIVDQGISPGYLLIVEGN